MPNWCNNVVKIKHAEPEMIERVITAFREQRLLQEFLPCPDDLLNTISGYMGKDTPEQAELEAKQARNLELYGYTDWYQWKVANWGTKWDVEGTIEKSADGVTLTFNSAWSPPCEAYGEMIDKHDFDIVAYYYESGMQFAGIWDNFADNFYESWGDAAGAKRMLPVELEQMFNIVEQQEEWEVECDTENDGEFDED